MCNEIFEVHSHRPDIPRNENATGVGSNSQNSWIGGPVRDYAGRASKVDGGLPAPQTPPDVRVKIRVGLKGNFQASSTDLSCLTRSKRSIMSAGMG
jgi:hypothetical protein